MLEELHSHRFVGGVGGRSRRAAEMIVFFGQRRRGSGPLVFAARLGWPCRGVPSHASARVGVTYGIEGTAWLRVCARAAVRVAPW